MKLERYEREIAIAQIREKAKAIYGEHDMSYLWGCSQILLKDKDIKTILETLGEKI